MYLIQPAALSAITFYQRFISPYKGFRCAHATLHKGDSCSQAVKKIIAKHGLWQSRPLIKERFAQCRLAAQQLHLGKVLSTSDDEEEERRRKRKEQAKDCGCDLADMGCDVVQNSVSCDRKPKDCLPDRDCLPDMDCVPDCGCGW